MNRLKMAWVIVSILFLITCIFQHEIDYSLLFMALSILLAGWIAGGE